MELTAPFNIFQLNTCQLCECVSYQCKTKMDCYFHFNYHLERNWGKSNDWCYRGGWFQCKSQSRLTLALKKGCFMESWGAKSKRAVQQKLSALNHLLSCIPACQVPKRFLGFRVHSDPVSRSGIQWNSVIRCCAPATELYYICPHSGRAECSGSWTDGDTTEVPVKRNNWHKILFFIFFICCLQIVPQTEAQNRHILAWRLNCLALGSSH